MQDSDQTPTMTADKAIAATIFSLVGTIALALLGITPTTETMLSTDLRALVENIAALVIMTTPGIAAYVKRNYLK